MTWTTTLEVVDCASTGTKLAGAKVELGLVEIGLTNAAGRIDAVLDDFNTLPIFKVSKADYVTDNFVLDKSIYAGTTRTVCLTNPTTIPDGQDPDVPGESGGKEFDSGGCFIVSAATGSAQSEEVAALRALRDRVAERSAIAASLIDAIYDEYRQFSPAVAERLDAATFARQSALMAAVRPLLAWYRLAGYLALDRDNERALKEVQQALRDACPRWLSPLSMAQRIAALRRREPVADNAPRTLRELAPHLHRAASLPLVNWAMLEPLERCWVIAAEQLDSVREVGRWLGDAPVERLCALPVGDAAAHGQAIASLLAFSAGDQERLVQRLQARAAQAITPAPLPRAQPGKSGCGCS